MITAFSIPRYTTNVVEKASLNKVNLEAKRDELSALLTARSFKRTIPGTSKQF
jgi:hypothetical protein